MTIPQTIVKALIGRDWVFGGELAREVGGVLKKKESNIERRMREMDNELEQRYVQIDGKGPHVVQYRLKRKEPIVFHQNPRNLSLAF